MSSVKLKKSGTTPNHDWLAQLLPLHQRLSAVVETTIENTIKKHQIEYLSVSSRTKTLESALEKLQRKEYSEPKSQLTDLSGIRIVTYLEAQVRQIGEIIKQLFEIDVENSHDRTETLGLDRIGYRSTHYVCTLGDTRNQLEEYEGLGDLKFEIQIRTVLQHAWAELAHDRSFKFGYELPTNIERKLNLYSGMLEIVDGAFDEIATSIDAYKDEIFKKTKSEISTTEIDSISIQRFLNEVSETIGTPISGRVTKSTLEEMRKFGIRTIGELRELLTPDFIQTSKKHYKSGSTAIGILRRLMMFSDLDRYIETKPSFGKLTISTFEFLNEKYSSRLVSAAFQKAGIEIETADE